MHLQPSSALNNNLKCIHCVLGGPGAMLAICDVNEYRKCVKEFHIPVIIQLFDTLHSLCNLLVVVPEHLKEVCTGEQLVCGNICCFTHMSSS